MGRRLSAAAVLAGTMAFPCAAMAIPAQVALAGIAFMLPVVPVVALLLVTGYLAATRNLKLKGFLGRLPGAVILIIVTVFVYTFFLKMSSTLGGLVAPEAESRLVEFVTDNAVLRTDVRRFDEALKMVRESPPGRWEKAVTIPAQVAAREILAGKLLVVDTRLAREYAASHVEGSIRFPRYELEMVTPDWSWQIAADKYLDTLAEIAREQGRRLAFCCSFGVSVSVRTVMELRQRDVDAVMIQGGCGALEDFGVPFSSDYAVSDLDRTVSPDVLDLWIRSGMVNTVVAGWPIIRSNGMDIPDGPLVVVTSGDSQQEKTLRVLTSAIAQSRGIQVVGQASLNRTARFSGMAGSVLFLGALIEQGLGPMSYFVVLFSLLVAIFVVLRRLLQSGEPVAAMRRSAPILALLGTALLVELILIEGTWMASRAWVVSGQHKWIYPILFVLSVGLAFHRFTWPMGVLPSCELTPRPVDGIVSRRGPYLWANLGWSVLLSAILIQASPIVVVMTLAVLGLLVLFNGARYLMVWGLSAGIRIRFAGHFRKPPVPGSPVDPTTDRVANPAVRDELMSRLLLNLAVTAFPGIWFRPGAAGTDMEIRTFVSGQPGKIEVRMPDGSRQLVGIISLQERDGVSVAERIRPRLRLSVAMAGFLGADLEVVFSGGRRLPSVGMVMPDSIARPAGAVPIDVILHRQILAMVADDVGLIESGAARDAELLSRERYVEQEAMPTPITFSALARRAARYGAADAAGTLFGFRKYFSRTVRFGAAVFEPEMARDPGVYGGKVRVRLAKAWIRILDSIFADFVLPAVVRFTGDLQRHGDRPAHIISSIRQIITRFAFWQEMTALSHAILISAPESTVAPQSERSARCPLPGELNRGLVGGGAFEFLPGDMLPAADSELSIGLVRLTSPFDRDVWRNLPEREHLIARAEYFRGAFRRVVWYLVQVTGRRLREIGRRNGLEDLVFFAGKNELAQVLEPRAGRIDSGFVAELARRQSEWKRLREIPMPVQLRIRDIEDMVIEPGGGMPLVETVEDSTPLRGTLVAGSLPVSGIARVAGADQDVRFAGAAGRILVVPVPDPATVAEMERGSVIICESGGRLSHAAMLARELGITMVSGVRGASRRIADGQAITVDSDGVVQTGMPTVAIGLASARDGCGNKAGALARLVAAGFPVPDGFVIPPEIVAGIGAASFNDDWAGAVWATVAHLDMGAGFIVRTSSFIEDSRSHSFAGMFRSVAGVGTREALESAVRECISAAAGEGVARLARLVGADSGGLPALVIQPLVPADFSGVAVCQSGPGSQSADVVLVEAERGTGGVVSGTGIPHSFRCVPDAGLPTRTGGPDDDGPASDIIIRVADLARGARDLFGCPIDIEWCNAGGDVWIVQARPLASPIVETD
ncbi:MAG TPA: PEP/pyruvate-binding domain-containing protein [Myxococcota bacterium]|nr:PEP/pyruvate-binding domain-containing protein [Myxococcota bacterium]